MGYKLPARKKGYPVSPEVDTPKPSPLALTVILVRFSRWTKFSRKAKSYYKGEGFSMFTA